MNELQETLIKILKENTKEKDFKIEMIEGNYQKDTIACAELFYLIITDSDLFDEFNDEIYEKLNEIILENGDKLKEFVNTDFDTAPEILVEIAFNKNTPIKYKEQLHKHDLIKTLSSLNQEIEDYDVYSFDVNLYSKLLAAREIELSYIIDKYNIDTYKDENKLAQYLFRFIHNESYKNDKHNLVLINSFSKFKRKPVINLMIQNNSMFFDLFIKIFTLILRNTKSEEIEKKLIRDSSVTGKAIMSHVKDFVKSDKSEQEILENLWS